MTELRRGQVVLAAERGDYTGKPRPMLIVQRTATLDASAGVTMCGFTTTVAATEPMRVAVLHLEGTGLSEPSMVMVDKVSTLRRERVREVIGELSDAKMREVDAALRRWLDL
jgi:mRNA interferase MazF